MASVSTVFRSLSVGSLDDWVDAAPVSRSRKSSIDSISSWCVAGGEDSADDWVNAQAVNDKSTNHTQSMLSWRDKEGVDRKAVEKGEKEQVERSEGEEEEEENDERAYESDSSWFQICGEQREGMNMRKWAVKRPVGSESREKEEGGEEEEECVEMTQEQQQQHSDESENDMFLFSDQDKRHECDRRRDSIESIESFSSVYSSVSFLQGEYENARGEEGGSQKEDRSRREKDEGEVEEGEEKWACVRCSFVNHSLLSVCEMCESERQYVDNASQGQEEIFIDTKPSPSVRLCPSFADVVRRQAEGVMREKIVASQRPVLPNALLKVPRARSLAGLKLLGKCTRMLSTSVPSIGAGAAKTRRSNCIIKRRRASLSGARTLYYLPEIEGIPEEDDSLDEEEETETEERNLHEIGPEIDYHITPVDELIEGDSLAEEEVYEPL